MIIIIFYDWANFILVIRFGTWGEMSPLCKVPLIGSNTIYAKFTSFQLKVHHDYDPSYKFGDWMAVKHSVPDTTMDVLHSQKFFLYEVRTSPI